MRGRRFAVTVFESGVRATLVASRAKRRGAKQKLREFALFANVVKQQKPRVVVEIGSWRGGTLWAWTRLAAPDALIVAIDLPTGGYGGSIESVSGLGRKRQRMTLIRGDSHDAGTLTRLQQTLKGAAIDLLFIDGDHSYGGVRQDFEMYAPLVAAGGIVAFHDVLPQELSEVDRLWAEIGRAGEVIADHSDVASRGAWGGIGFIRVLPVSP